MLTLLIVGGALAIEASGNCGPEKWDNASNNYVYTADATFTFDANSGKLTITGNGSFERDAIFSSENDRKEIKDVESVVERLQ